MERNSQIHWGISSHPISDLGTVLLIWDSNGFKQLEVGRPRVDLLKIFQTHDSTELAIPKSVTRTPSTVNICESIPKKTQTQSQTAVAEAHLAVVNPQEPYAPPLRLENMEG